jgi:hypothetical protein
MNDQSSDGVGSQPTSAEAAPLPPPPIDAGTLRPASSETAPPPPKRPRTRTILFVAVALVVVGGLIGVAIASGGSGRPGASSKASAPPTGKVGSPVGLIGEADTAPIGVKLTWSAPAGKVKVLGYLVYRNGTQIGSVPADTTTYTDTNVVPGEAYTYGVVTRGAGLIQSDRATAVVEVPVPTLSAARLDGIFDVTAKTVSQSGYQEKLGTLKIGWSFRPNCHFGPCGVHWSDVTSDSLRAILARRGKVYSGTDEGKFFGRCGRTPLPSTVRIKIRVTKADIVVGEWRAVRFVGTLKESHTARLGCVSGGATFLIRGTLAD